ncbi:MAG: Smr/MutS family protein [Gammaproteobacteria bacterium]|jgi:DNA-nicking Smr family endonuclease|nr:Smr/MutS family protein [Gammaproteobacteria bacterium]MBU0771726.1 Smr/MutS family protein [Gammaproteobacteria bacterium]MBU0856999.1 Smr/MutS family protein [Gammaproteobacteria bacterium]MBU1848300.1 Smr/MutS family protein [Gammaproteobacteria bacterium]
MATKKTPRNARPHAPSEEDIALFRQAVEGVHRMHDDRAQLDRPPPRAWPLQRDADNLSVLAESIRGPLSIDLRLEGGEEPSFLRTGLTRNVLRDLRRGRWVSQGQIDLHGATRDAAHDLVVEFLHDAHRRGLRCIRVIHGKGLGSPGREPVLKGLVLGWLMHRPEVLAFCQARPHEGGAGALMVLLKPASRT